MRYNEIINEANYRNYFDTATTFKTDAEFKKHVGDKFGALKGDAAKESKPQAGGAVYIIDPTQGIVGYKKPNEDSPSGFVWYSVKTPFKPATKGAKAEPAKAAEPAAPKAKATAKEKLVMNIVSSGRADIKGMVEVNKAALGGYTEYSDIIAYLKGKPGMAPDVWVNGAGGSSSAYEKAWVLSHTHTGAQLVTALRAKSTFTGQAKAKADPKAAELDAQGVKVGIEVALRTLLNTLQNMRSPNMHGRFQTYDIEENPHAGNGEIVLTTGIRDWGVWELPQEAYDSDDTEDYDWEELSSASRAKMRGIIDDFNKRYPNIQFSFQTSEKNWIDIKAKAK